jgi:hypothetical protein
MIVARTSSILSINLLGKFSLHVGDHEIELLSRKTKALLGYLALTETQEESRERLIGLFWSEGTGRAGAGVLAPGAPRDPQCASAHRFRTDSTPTNLSSGSIGRGSRVDLIDVRKDATGGLAASAAAAAARPDR